MPKKRRNSTDKGRMWRSPCLTALTLLLYIAITAFLVQRGILKTASIKPALLGGALVSGLIGATAGEKGERRALRLLLGPGIPALFLLSAALLGGGERDLVWPLSCAFLLLLPSLCRLLLGRDSGKRRRSAGRRSAGWKKLT